MKNIMWFDKSNDDRVLMDYDVHNDAYSYDEYYSESSSEFFEAPSLVNGAGVVSFAQESIINAIIRKLKDRL